MGRGASRELLDEVTRFSIDDLTSLSDAARVGEIRGRRNRLEFLTETLSYEGLNISDLEVGDDVILLNALQEKDLQAEVTRLMRYLIVHSTGLMKTLFRERLQFMLTGDKPSPRIHLLIRRELERAGLREIYDPLVVSTTEMLHLIREEGDRETLCGLSIDKPEKRYRHGHFMMIDGGLRCVTCRERAGVSDPTSGAYKTANTLPSSPAVEEEVEREIVAKISEELRLAIIKDIPSNNSPNLYDYSELILKRIHEEVAIIAANEYSELPLGDRFYKMFEIDPGFGEAPEGSILQIAQIMRDCVEYIAYENFRAFRRPIRWPRKDSLAKTIAKVPPHMDTQLSRLKLAAFVVKEHFPEAIPSIRDALNEQEGDSRWVVLEIFNRENP
jgi:hypothetical protein